MFSLILGIAGGVNIILGMYHEDIYTFGCGCTVLIMSGLGLVRDAIITEIKKNKT